MINPRQGRKCLVHSVKKSPFQALRYSSLPIHGAKLFNSLPKQIRNITKCTKEFFKHKLDSFLAEIPDEPQVTGYTAHRQANSNGLLDMVPIAKQNYNSSLNSFEVRWCKNNMAVEQNQED